MNDFTVDNNEDDDTETPESQTFQITYHDGKTDIANGYLAIGDGMAIIGDSNGRFNYATHMSTVHHIKVVPTTPSLSVVPN